MPLSCTSCVARINQACCRASPRTQIIFNLFISCAGDMGLAGCKKTSEVVHMGKGGQFEFAEVREELAASGRYGVHSASPLHGGGRLSQSFQDLDAPSVLFTAR